MGEDEAEREIEIKESTTKSTRKIVFPSSQKKKNKPEKDIFFLNVFYRRLYRSGDWEIGTVTERLRLRLYERDCISLV